GRARGQALFTTAGCVVCHRDAPGKPAPAPLYGVPVNYPLGDLGAKTTPEKLAAFLLDPLATHPAGRMPNPVLSSSEAADLANHLCAESAPDPGPAEPGAAELAALRLRHALPADADWRAAGRYLFAARGCVHCHPVEEGGKPIAAVPAKQSLADVRQAIVRGCLGPSGLAPRFGFGQAERDALAAFLHASLEGAGSPAPTHAARAALTRFNCLAC